MTALFRTILIALVLAWPGVASAEVKMHFQSFNGSYFFGRYPHTYVVLEGTLTNGKVIDENYGFSAKASTAAVLRGPVQQTILIEDAKTIRKSNRHFTVTISDAQYARVNATMRKWRDAPEPYYDLNNRNCIHFVGTLAAIAGLKIAYPSNMMRRPKKWLNYIARLNPQLGAKQI